MGEQQEDPTSHGVTTAPHQCAAIPALQPGQGVSSGPRSWPETPGSQALQHGKPQPERREQVQPGCPTRLGLGLAAWPGFVLAASASCSRPPVASACSIPSAGPEGVPRGRGAGRCCAESREPEGALDTPSVGLGGGAEMQEAGSRRLPWAEAPNLAPEKGLGGEGRGRRSSSQGPLGAVSDPALSGGGPAPRGPACCSRHSSGGCLLEGPRPGQGPGAGPDQRGVGRERPDPQEEGQEEALEARRDRPTRGSPGTPAQA